MPRFIRNFFLFQDFQACSPFPLFRWLCSQQVFFSLSPSFPGRTGRPVFLLLFFLNTFEPNRVPPFPPAADLPSRLYKIFSTQEVSFSWTLFFLGYPPLSNFCILPPFATQFFPGSPERRGLTPFSHRREITCHKKFALLLAFTFFFRKVGFLPSFLPQDFCGKQSSSLSECPFFPLFFKFLWVFPFFLVARDSSPFFFCPLSSQKQKRPLFFPPLFPFGCAAIQIFFSCLGERDFIFPPPFFPFTKPAFLFFPKLAFLPTFSKEGDRGPSFFFFSIGRFLFLPFWWDPGFFGGILYSPPPLFFPSGSLTFCALNWQLPLPSFFYRLGVAPLSPFLTTFSRARGLSCPFFFFFFSFLGSRCLFFFPLPRTVPFLREFPFF